MEFSASLELRCQQADRRRAKLGVLLGRWWVVSESTQVCLLFLGWMISADGVMDETPKECDNVAGKTCSCKQHEGPGDPCFFLPSASLLEVLVASAIADTCMSRAIEAGAMCVPVPTSNHAPDEIVMI